MAAELKQHRDIFMGVDIESVERIRAAVARFGKRFLQRIYTQSELDYCMKKRDPYPHLAARFAAKEAAVKAFAPLMKTYTRNFEIVATENAPRLLERGAGKLPSYKTTLSLSHTNHSVVAAVIVYRCGDEK